MYALYIVDMYSNSLFIQSKKWRKTRENMPCGAGAKVKNEKKKIKPHILSLSVHGKNPST